MSEVKIDVVEGKKDLFRDHAFLAGSTDLADVPVEKLRNAELRRYAVGAGETSSSGERMKVARALDDIKERAALCLSRDNVLEAHRLLGAWLRLDAWLWSRVRGA